MYKIGVIGDKQSVSGFLAVGLAVFPCEDVEKARETLDKLVKSGSYAIIYVTENYCKHMSKEFEQYKDIELPAIIPIPGMDGSHGIGVGRSKKAVERAVGVDIIYRNQE
ncbi:MAG: V-type ATP synthase subunit F [Clostridia bacterium]|nr:V-type ATP synthase subunit F [Clostridia bacterium]